MDLPKEKSIEKAKIDSKKKNKMSFKDLGVMLQSSEVSKYSKLYDNLTVKFTDDNYLYTLIITIDIKEGLPKTEEKPMMCDIKLKKYDLDTFEVIGQLPSPIDGERLEPKFNCIHLGAHGALGAIGHCARGASAIQCGARVCREKRAR
jgi:hypothetical protein